MRVFSEGDDLYRLEDGTGMHIGTIRGRTISFRGLPTEDAARDAAVAAWGALNDALRREYPSWPHHELALDRIGRGARRRVRVVLRRRAGDRAPGSAATGSREHTFGVELVLPSYSSEGVAIMASHGMARAVAPYREESLELLAVPDPAA